MLSLSAAHTTTGSVLQHAVLDGIVVSTGLVFQNALTLANTDLLFATGVLAVIVMHGHAVHMLAHIQY